MQLLLVAYVQGAWIYLFGIAVVLQLAVLLHKVRVRRRLSVYLTAAIGSLALFVPTVIYLSSTTDTQLALNGQWIALAGCLGFFASVLLAVTYFASYQPHPAQPKTAPAPVRAEPLPQPPAPEPAVAQAPVAPPPPAAAPAIPLLNAWLREEDRLNRAYQLSEGRTLIGRHSDCGVHLNDPAVSRFHASLQYREGAFLLADENSRTGTFVNGQRIDGQPYHLQTGDRIVLGDTTLGFFQE